MINGLLHARGALDPPPGQLRQQQNHPAPPLWRQRLPNTRRQRFAHDATQASARQRKALGIRVSAIRPILATYKRQLVWGIELFFKWIKQHLRIKRFYGTSENAVKTQLWIAISVYVLVAIVKKRLALDASLYTLLQVLSVALFEKIPINQALAIDDPKPNSSQETNQLELLAF
jgi:hypothetical protein